jgi:hypothetical protein
MTVRCRDALCIIPGFEYLNVLMSTPPYIFKREESTRYRFFSTGRKSVEKIVLFTPLSQANIYNLGFGDLLSNGEIDDRAKSNNGDIIKVLSTVIYIIKDFTATRPVAKIAFKGSTKERTVLYQRILKTYWESFSKEFLITALEGPKNKPTETIFDPGYKGAYLAFFIKRKS